MTVGFKFTYVRIKNDKVELRRFHIDKKSNAPNIDKKSNAPKDKGDYRSHMHQTGLAMSRKMYAIGFGIFAALTLTACSSEKTNADDQGSNLRSLMERLEFLEENDRKHGAQIRDLETTVEKKTQMISELEILVRKQNAEIKDLKEHYLKFSKSLDDDVTYPEKSNEIKYSMEKKKRILVQPNGEYVSIGSPY